VIPGDRPAELFGELDDLGGERVRDDIRGVTVRQADEHHEAGLALDERRDRAHALAEDQVTLPMTRDCPVVRFSRALADVHGVAELALAVHVRVAQRPPVRSTGPEMMSEL